MNASRLLFLTILLLSASDAIQGQTTGPLTLTSDTTLTQDHIGRIFITADDVTLDCDNHSIISASTGSGIGVSVDSRSGVTVVNCYVSGFAIGLFSHTTSHVMFANNEAHDNAQTGIGVVSSHWPKVVNNYSHHNGEGIAISNGSTKGHVQDNLAEQNANFGIRIAGAHENKILNNIFRDSGTGIAISNSDKNNFKRNESEGNALDLSFHSGEDNNFNNNRFGTVFGL